jgi:hypothetical protein
LLQCDYAGAPITRILPKSVVRGLVALVGFSMSAVFFCRLVQQQASPRREPTTRWPELFLILTFPHPDDPIKTLAAPYSVFSADV